MTIAIDPKINKITYSDPARTKAFGDALGKAMVDNLNKKVLAEKQLIEKLTAKQLKAIEQMKKIGPAMLEALNKAKREGTEIY